jgi:hypothetical protein
MSTAAVSEEQQVMTDEAAGLKPAAITATGGAGCTSESGTTDTAAVSEEQQSVYE